MFSILPVSLLPGKESYRITVIIIYFLEYIWISEFHIIFHVPFCFTIKYTVAKPLARGTSGIGRISDVCVCVCVGGGGGGGGVERGLGLYYYYAQSKYATKSKFTICSVYHSGTVFDKIKSKHSPPAPPPPYTHTHTHTYGRLTHINIMRLHWRCLTRYGTCPTLVHSYIIYLTYLFKMSTDEGV